MGINDECTFSDGWLKCFNFGMGFQSWDVSGMKKSADQNDATKYCETYEQLVKDNDLTADKFIMQMKQEYFGDVYQPQYWPVKVEHRQVALSKIRVD
jgi:hypothetical protein